jgi:hypothetical protein
MAKRIVTLGNLVGRSASGATALRLDAIETSDFPARKMARHSHIHRENSPHHTANGLSTREMAITEANAFMPYVHVSSTAERQDDEP